MVGVTNINDIMIISPRRVHNKYLTKLRVSLNYVTTRISIYR